MFVVFAKTWKTHLSFDRLMRHSALSFFCSSHRIHLAKKKGCASHVKSVDCRPFIIIRREKLQDVAFSIENSFCWISLISFDDKRLLACSQVQWHELRTVNQPTTSYSPTGTICVTKMELNWIYLYEKIENEKRKRTKNPLLCSNFHWIVRKITFKMGENLDGKLPWAKHSIQRLDFVVFRMYIPSSMALL